MNKVKMLTDVVSEVKKEAPQDVPNWSSKFAEAQINLKNQLEKGKTLPKGVEDHPLKVVQMLILIAHFPLNMWTIMYGKVYL